MKCTKCGKEIPDGDEKMCKECQDALLKELSEDETNEEVVTDEKAKKKAKKEKKEKKEKVAKQPKEKKESKLDKKMIAVIVGTIIAIILIIAAGLLVNKVFFTGIVGNSIGNIRNYGYATEKDGVVYYLSPNEKSTAVTICKMDAGKPETKQTIYAAPQGVDIISINVVGNYVYFIEIQNQAVSETDLTDNKISKITLNGEKYEVINNNNFNNDCYEIYVVDNYVYYIGSDSNVYRTNISGANEEKILDYQTGYLGITGKYIIFNKAAAVSSEESDTTYVTYICDLDGLNEQPLVNGQRLYSLNVEGDYVYYTDEDMNLKRTLIGSGEEELLKEVNAYNLNSYKGELYYLNYKNVEEEDYTIVIYRFNPETKEETVVAELNAYTSFLNIACDGVVFMDSASDSGYINHVNINDKTETKLYLLDYTTYDVEDNSYLPDGEEEIVDEVVEYDAGVADESASEEINEQLYLTGDNGDELAEE